MQPTLYPAPVHTAARQHTTGLTSLCYIRDCRSHLALPPIQSSQVPSCVHLLSPLSSMPSLYLFISPQMSNIPPHPRSQLSAQEQTRRQREQTLSAPPFPPCWGAGSPFRCGHGGPSSSQTSPCSLHCLFSFTSGKQSPLSPTFQFFLFWKIPINSPIVLEFLSS